MMLVKHSHRKHFIDDSAHAKEKNPAKIVIGVPVASHNAIEKLKTKVDEVISVLVPAGLYEVGAFYRDFEQVNGEEAKRYVFAETHKEMRKAN